MYSVVYTLLVHCARSVRADRHVSEDLTLQKHPCTPVRYWKAQRREGPPPPRGLRPYRYVHTLLQALIRRNSTQRASLVSWSLALPTAGPVRCLCSSEPNCHFFEYHNPRARSSPSRPPTSVVITSIHYTTLHNTRECSSWQTVHDRDA